MHGGKESRSPELLSLGAEKILAAIMSSTAIEKKSKIVTPMSVSLCKMAYKIIKYGLPLIRHFYKINSEDTKGDFRDRCRELDLKMVPSAC